MKRIKYGVQVHQSLFFSSHFVIFYYFRSFHVLLFNIFCSEKILTMRFLRKYLHMAKGVKPVLTEEAPHILASRILNFVPLIHPKLIKNGWACCFNIYSVYSLFICSFKIFSNCRLCQ